MILSLGVLDAHEAKACGGCGVMQSESTQVTGHRMILSISNDATTLWDQIEYTGNPKDFGWMLPIKGNSGFVLQTDFDVSSDALFATLEQLSQVTISSPTINCPQSSCNTAATGAGGPFDDEFDNGGGGVTVVAEKVAGPFQIVHLQATQPNALKDWLAANNYVVSPESYTIIDAYVAEQFDFIAVKLVPGEGVSSMRPVRIKLPGAAPTLPLRMVGVGTGAVTAMTLFVIGEGRYETTNFPTFTINETDLVWSWDTSSSNYKALRKQGFDAAEGKTWLVEAAEPTSPYSIKYPLESLVNYDVQNSGYGDENGMGATEELYADLDALNAGINEGSMWITRLHAELPRAALAADLSLGASPKQEYVQRFLQATQATGNAPACPPVQECGGDSAEGSVTEASSGGCAMSGESGLSAAFGGLALSAALAYARRRRARK